MKMFFAMIIFSFSVSAFTQTQIVVVNPEFAEEAHETFMESNTGIQRQEQEESILDHDMTYEEAEDIYGEDTINAYEARNQTDEGLNY